MIAGAVAATGVISVAAARSFHGHTATTAGSASQPAQSSSAGTPASSGSDGSPQQPAQAPAAAPAQQAPAPVVSGGS